MFFLGASHSMFHKSCVITLSAITLFFSIWQVEGNRLTMTYAKIRVFLFLHSILTGFSHLCSPLHLCLDSSASMKFPTVGEQQSHLQRDCFSCGSYTRDTASPHPVWPMASSWCHEPPSNQHCLCLVLQHKHGDLGGG